MCKFVNRSNDGASVNKGLGSLFTRVGANIERFGTNESVVFLDIHSGSALDF